MPVLLKSLRRGLTGFKVFGPSGEFLAAAKPIVDRIEATVGEDQARHAAMKRLDSFAYPLTIAGMIMSVFAIGQLMSNPPNGGKTPRRN